MSKTAMGSRAALTEAQSLWGKRGAIQRQGGVCRVGIATRWFFWTYGKGKSWSAAFGDYYDRVGKPEPRIPTKEEESLGSEGQDSR